MAVSPDYQSGIDRIRAIGQLFIEHANRLENILDEYPGSNATVMQEVARAASRADGELDIILPAYRRHLRDYVEATSGS